MGKGGRGAGKKAAAAAEADEDALLNAAIAQVKIEREKTEKEAAQAKADAAQKAVAAKGAKAAKAAAKAKMGTTLTMEATLAKLDVVMTFTIARLMPDGSRDLIPGPNGAITFYLDAEDVEADLAAMKTAEPSLQLGLDFAPLGRAFALMQGLMGLRAPGPTKLEFSRAVVKAVGEQGVPPEFREQMRDRGPFPLYYSDKFGSENFTPVFFTKADFKAFWCGVAGGTEATLPPATVTDLRIVVMRTLQEPGSWEPLNYVPSQAAEPLTKQLMARAQREKQLSQGFASGAMRLKAVAHAVAVDEGDEPPALA